MKRVSHLPPIRDQLGRAIKDLRISVMDRCNFRCVYCMPEDKFHPGFKFLPSKERLSFDEMFRLVKIFTKLGVSKIRITGGEPLLRVNLTDFIGDLSTLDRVDDIALTTNGVLLKKYAHELKASGLNRITISLDSIDPDEFRLMTGNRGDIKRVLDGISEAQVAGFEKIKINAVIKRGVNNKNILNMVDYFKDQPVILRFIEYMDVGNINQWQQKETVPSSEIIELISNKWPISPIKENYEGEVASRYIFDDLGTEIGFISSVTNPFCGGCTRARLSSDGKLYNCLFASTGADIKSWIRSGMDDYEIEDRLVSIWRKRDNRYSELRYLKQNDADEEKVEMYYIGG
ncbi:MAG: GTP 3',8-cyclase MoaA [Gammaproteobacteria bacterium]|nr:GTP 3',8-cyclase MoaA [Gammaproteobacteria bacterium]